MYLNAYKYFKKSCLKPVAIKIEREQQQPAKVYFWNKSNRPYYIDKFFSFVFAQHRSISEWLQITTKINYSEFCWWIIKKKNEEKKHLNACVFDAVVGIKIKYSYTQGVNGSYFAHSSRDTNSFILCDRLHRLRNGPTFSISIQLWTIINAKSE